MISLTKDLKLRYHYAERAEQYSFYRMPKVLFTDKRFKGLSTEAKVLYGLMLDRMGLSVKHQWFDEKNRVYIYYSLEDAMEHLGCGKDKGVKLFAELDTEKGYGLIERKKQGQGKPAIIYVKELCGNAEVLTSENPKSALRENRSQDFGKSDPNNTNINNTDFSDTDLINPSTGYDIKKYKPPPFLIDKMEERKIYRQLILKNIEYDVLKELYDKKMLNEIIEIMTDAVCSSNPLLRIGGGDFPVEVVKGRFLKVSSQHIEYIFECINKNTSKVRNIKSYLLTTIYNSVSTMNHYYTAEVNHDLYGQT